MKTIHIGIADFALPVPRTGHIESHSGYGPAPNIGQELHAMIQSRRQQEFGEYRPEHRISQSFERDHYQFVISGRMDGFFDRTVPRIEEIKTAFNAKELSERLRSRLDHPYRLQLATYAYFHFLQTGVAAETVLHVVSSRTLQGEDLEFEFSPEQTRAWFERRLDELVVEARAFEKTVRRRKKIAKDFVFPFQDPRPGQTELIEAVEKTIAEKKYLLAQAPTGLGKTAGVLYPSLKDALGRGQKVIYVTPKNSQHAVAEDAVQRFQETGAKVKALTINAKAKMCMKTEVLCNPKHCEFARDYYAKVAEKKLLEELARKRNLTPRVFRKMAAEHEVCPFELQLDSVKNVDVVICDYNYVFSPRNSIGRLTHDLSQKKTRPNLVIDEAHNLPSRATDYFSPSLAARDLAGFLEESNRLPDEFQEAYRDLVSRGLELIGRVGSEAGHRASRVRLEARPFTELEGEIRGFLSRYLEAAAEVLERDPVLRFADQWTGFSEALLALSEKFFVTYKPDGRGGSVKITCCDASEFLKETYSAFANVAAFSATLKPFDYYARLSGLSPDKLVTAEFNSPFPRENRKLLVIPQVSTRYSERERNYSKIAGAIEKIVNLRPGNYFVFLPSFEFLEQIARRVNPQGFKILKQEREIKAARVRETLNELRSNQQPTLAFAVQGGVFAEGVDYPGEMVIGAIIVGPALPNYDVERESLKEYYEKSYGSGFDYAYTFPAMAKVIQSAGRVIRSPRDRGLIVLMDQRFVEDSYAKSMPSDWIESSVQELVSNRILGEISEFWNEEAR